MLVEKREKVARSTSAWTDCLVEEPNESNCFPFGVAYLSFSLQAMRWKYLRDNMLELCQASWWGSIWCRDLKPSFFHQLQMMKPVSCPDLIRFDISPLTRSPCKRGRRISMGLSKSSCCKADALLKIQVPPRRTPPTFTKRPFPLN